MQSKPKARWGTCQIWLAGAFGAMLAGSERYIDFSPLDGPGLRDFLDFSQLALFLPLTGFLIMGLLITAVIAVWRRRFRLVVSSISAIMAIPICFVVVAKVPLFDPWLWYVIANRTRFEALAASSQPPDEPKYVLIETRDVSAGLVINGNHFITLIYDESDAIGLDPAERPSIWQTRRAFGYFPMPRGRRLCGHFFRVDEFL